MKRKYLGLLVMGLFGLAFASPTPAQERSGEIVRWDFDVFLNDRKVGKHMFTVSEAAGMKEVRSEASFKYAILLIPAYRYERSGAGFRVDSGDNPAELPECVTTFACWSPEVFDQRRLLNRQTGEYVAVQVEEIGHVIRYELS